jgi:hypothetical protein
MYIPLLSTVVACCPLAKQTFRHRLVFTLFALLFIHSLLSVGLAGWLAGWLVACLSLSLSFSFSFSSPRAIYVERLIILMNFYYDYI